MTRRITDEDDLRTTDRLYARLKKSPFYEKRSPSGHRIAIIQQRVSDDLPPGKRIRRLWFKWSGAVVACIVLMFAFNYVYYIPGGISDWRYSRSAGYSDTLSIPIGKTPVEAVQKFRQFASMQVVHQESIDGGVLLFIKRYYQKDGTDLQIEFVRKTWLGWKWVMGGGYGLSSRSDLDEALNYMSIPKFKGIHGPFPIVFGQITNSTITNVFITIGGDDAGKYNAKLIEYGVGQRLWYVVLPSSADAPYEIEALNGKGTKVARKSFDDSRDVASVLMSK